MAANFSQVYSAELEGIEASLVEVETDLHVGLHAFSIVGLADKAVSEAKERVTSALKNSGIKPPTKENRRVVVNLAPADWKKAGSQFDLAIALGYLLASGQIKTFVTQDKLFVGELALNGCLRPIRGALNIAHLCQRKKIPYLFLPLANAAEAAIVKEVQVIPLNNLSQAILLLEGKAGISRQSITVPFIHYQAPTAITLDEIKGQENAKRALLVAAAGGHNLLLVGPPGGGKTMLAQALISLLPPLTTEELIEVTQIYSAVGLLGDRSFVESRPFRSPHHTASEPALIGGGSSPRPGEISLAHRGVLFLDELPEFHRDVLESLRQPLEAGRMVVARSRQRLNLPAEFILVAAMNPCPCGYQGDELKQCSCLGYEIHRYQKKVSGPLLDRIDLQINVPRVELEELRIKNYQLGKPQTERAREEVGAVRQRQLARQGRLNAQLTSKKCDQLIQLTPAAEQFLEQSWEKSLLTARGYYRLLKVAQTVADLAGLPKVDQPQIMEAFGYRLRQQKL